MAELKDLEHEDGRPGQTRAHWAFSAFSQDGKTARLLLSLVLTLVTLFCYWPITRHDFVSMDDEQYVTQNDRVIQGLTWAGFKWAFTSTEASNWHPVTWLSHMLDCQVYGLNSGGHHFTNLLLHILNTALLFLVLTQMTGTIWRSAFVAALFAWHPLHVESVAWAAERKDVLSTLFFLLTLGAYARYAAARGPVERQVWSTPGSSTPEPRNSTLAYSLALLFFTLGLMSKPMLVTLPFLLLLLDYWPLERLPLALGRSSGRLSCPSFSKQLLTLVLEKLPFFALATASSIVTYLVQKAGGAVSSLTTLPLHLRVENTLVAYGRYLGKAVWPARLAVIYPYPDNWSLRWVVGSAAMLLILSAICVREAKRSPYLVVGWLWFLGTLVPTIGLVQVGPQSLADRYTYIPGIGLALLSVWGASDALGRLAHPRWILCMIAAAALVACVAGTSIQVSYWQDSETLFRHTLRVTQDNAMAHDCLGRSLVQQGKLEEGIEHLTEAVRIRPAFVEAHINLGEALFQQGKLDEAEAQFLRALSLLPGSMEAQYNLGIVSLKQGRASEAVEHLRVALRFKPDYAEGHVNLGQALAKEGKLREAEEQLFRAQQLSPTNLQAQYNLGTVLLQEGKMSEAAAHLSRALKLKPDYAEAHGNLGIALMALGEPAQGVAHFSEALRINPNDAETACNLGIALLQLKHPEKAAVCLAESVRLKPDSPRANYFLAVALARQEKVNEATSHAEKARDLARAAGQAEWAAKAEALLKLCRSGEPLPPSL